MNIAKRYFPNTIARDFFDTFVADKPLARGSARIVYPLRHDPTMVCKIEVESGSFQNILEDQIWSEIQHTKLKKWFAPVECISACGSVMLMRRTRPMEHDQYPKRVPHFFTDLKYQNFGWYDGRFVCHDYGVPLLTNGYSKRMVKAEWWDE